VGEILDWVTPLFFGSNFSLSLLNFFPISTFFPNFNLPLEGVKFSKKVEIEVFQFRLPLPFPFGN
jgi:hypothetical protein